MGASLETMTSYNLISPGFTQRIRIVKKFIAKRRRTFMKEDYREYPLQTSQADKGIQKFNILRKCNISWEERYDNTKQRFIIYFQINTVIHITNKQRYSWITRKYYGIFLKNKIIFYKLPIKPGVYNYAITRVLTDMLFAVKFLFLEKFIFQKLLSRFHKN